MTTVQDAAMEIMNTNSGWLRANGYDVCARMMQVRLDSGNGPIQEGRSLETRCIMHADAATGAIT
jgi:hypothetical protein